MKTITKLIVVSLLIGVWMISEKMLVYAQDNYDPCVIKVNPRESIQAAIELANTKQASGMKCDVWIAEGIYNEDVKIGENHAKLKNLVLSGAAKDKTVIKGTILVHFFQSSGGPTDGGITTIKNLTLDGENIRPVGLNVAFEYVRADSIHAKNYTDQGVFVQGSTARLEMQHSVVDHNKNGVMSAYGSARMFLLNNTIANNQNVGAWASYDGASNPLARVVNNIIYGNGKGVSGGVSSGIFLEYNNFFANGSDLGSALPVGDYFGTSIFADPQLVNPDAGDYQLKPSSPCINTGDPVSPFDPDGTRSDIGGLPTSHTPSICTGDLTQDSKIDQQDLGVLLSMYGSMCV